MPACEGYQIYRITRAARDRYQYTGIIRFTSRHNDWTTWWWWRLLEDRLHNQSIIVTFWISVWTYVYLCDCMSVCATVCLSVWLMSVCSTVCLLCILLPESDISAWPLGSRHSVAFSPNFVAILFILTDHSHIVDKVVSVATPGS